MGDYVPQWFSNCRLPKIMGAGKAQLRDPPARPAPAFLSQEASAGAEILYPTHLPDDTAGAGPGTAPGEPLVSPRSKDLGVERGAPGSLHTASTTQDPL